MICKRVDFSFRKMGRLLQLLVVTGLLVVAGDARAQGDSAVVRMIVDQSIVSVTEAGDTLQTDAYGNPLTPDSWFILNLAPGDYEFRFYRTDGESITRQVSLTAGEILTLDGGS